MIQLKLDLTKFFEIIYNLINIYELISVCPWICNVWMISETACSSQTKLIGLNLHVSKHRIGYSNLVLVFNGGPKKLIFTFKLLKCLHGLKIQSTNTKDCLKNILYFIFIWPLRLREVQAIKAKIQFRLQKYFEKSKSLLHPQIKKTSSQKTFECWLFNLGLCLISITLESRELKLSRHLPDLVPISFASAKWEFIVTYY